MCSVRIGTDGGECLDDFEDFFFEEEEEERESLEKGLKFGTLFDPVWHCVVRMWLHPNIVFIG